VVIIDRTFRFNSLRGLPRKEKSRMRKAPGLDTIFGYCAVSVKFTGVPPVNEAVIFSTPGVGGNV